MDGVVDRAQWMEAKSSDVTVSSGAWRPDSLHGAEKRRGEILPSFRGPVICHLDLQPLTSRLGTEKISDVLSHLVCDFITTNL
jgi:hypothetical protein